jgi:hypothetical protein
LTHIDSENLILTKIIFQATCPSVEKYEDFSVGLILIGDLPKW